MKNINWIVIAIAVCVVVFLSIGKCNDKRTILAQTEEIANYKDTAMVFRGKSGELYSYNQALKVSLNTFMASTSDSIKRMFQDLKIKPSTITIIKEIIRIDSIPSVPLNIKNCKFDTTFQLINPYYQINGTISNAALSLKSISIPNTATIVVGDQKQKWFKSREYVVTLKNSNPNVKTEGIQSYTFEDKESRFSVGPSIGYGIYYDPVKSAVGHGFTGSIAINYRIIGWKKK